LQHELYIYWRIGATPLGIALQTAAAFQQQLRLEFPGLQARLLHRAAGTEKATVMEVYSRPGGVGEELAQHIEREAARALAAWPQPPQRHREVFMPYEGSSSVLLPAGQTGSSGA
jgi:hypothetical protein